MNNMYLTDIKNINDETIENVLFSLVITKYLTADCLILLGSHIK